MLDEHYVETLRNFIRNQPKSERVTSIGQLKQLVIAGSDEDVFEPCILCEGTGLARAQILSAYQPGTDLIRYLKQYRKPNHIIPECKPGEAPRKPEETRWICSLCINDKQIKTRTNDLRGHMEKDHGCRKQDLNHIFNRKDPDRLWDYFGPCTEEQASENGWEVRGYREAKKQHGTREVSGKRFSKISVHNFGDAVKRTFGVSRSNSDLEKSIESLSISPRPHITTFTDMSGMTYVQPTEPSFTTGTFCSGTDNVHQGSFEPLSSLQCLSTDYDRLEDSTELGKQFDSTPDAPILPNLEPSYIGSIENISWIDLTSTNNILQDNDAVPPCYDQAHFDGRSSPMDVSQPEGHYHSYNENDVDNLDVAVFQQFLVGDMTNLDSHQRQQRHHHPAHNLHNFVSPNIDDDYDLTSL